MSNNKDTDSDVSELDPKELSQALLFDKYAPQLGYAEDPEAPLTAETFPSKSGGKPVSRYSPLKYYTKILILYIRHG